MSRHRFKPPLRRRPLTTWVPMGLFCIGAVVNPLVPTWVFLSLMLPGLVLISIGWWEVNREYRQMVRAIDFNERSGVDHSQ